MPLYVFCGRHLLAAKLRPARMEAAAGAVQEVARIVAQIRRRWPHVRILLRADSGFAREELMAWCEANGVYFLFGLQKNDRLIAEMASELARAEAQSRRTGKPARSFKSFMWATVRGSWTCLSTAGCLMSPVSRALSHETPPCGSRRTALAEIRKSTPCKANCCKTPCDQRFLTKALIARINPDISRRRVMASAV